MLIESQSNAENDQFWLSGEAEFNAEIFFIPRDHVEKKAFKKNNPQ